MEKTTGAPALETSADEAAGIADEKGIVPKPTWITKTIEIIDGEDYKAVEKHMDTLHASMKSIDENPKKMYKTDEKPPDISKLRKNLYAVRKQHEKFRTHLAKIMRNEVSMPNGKEYERLQKRCDIIIAGHEKLYKETKRGQKVEELLQGLADEPSRFDETMEGLQKLK